jgi:Gram-negative bacterial TonB protein C-terminal
MRSFSRFVAMLAVSQAIFPASAFAAKEPLLLKPSSAWYVNYANDSCRLGRQFGTGDELVYAFFDRYGPSEYFRLTLVGKPVRPPIQKAEASIQFGPEEKVQKLYFMEGSLDKVPALLFGSSRVAPPSDAEQAAIDKRDADDEWIDPAAVSDTRLKAIKYLTVGKPLRRSVTLETGSMRAAFAATDKCIDNLMTTWGIDTTKHKTLSRYAVPKQSPGRWVVSSDYPLDMLQSGQPAIVEFRLSVGPDGVPTGCHIQSTTRPKAFDDAVCKSVMRRARFDPALDAEGKPLASYYRNTVRFQIP